MRVSAEETTVMANCTTDDEQNFPPAQVLETITLCSEDTNEEMPPLEKEDFDTHNESYELVNVEEVIKYLMIRYLDTGREYLLKELKELL